VQTPAQNNTRCRFTLKADIEMKKIASTCVLVRQLVGENVNPVNFRRFGKEVARLGFFHQSRRVQSAQRSHESLRGRL
jgi:hypothetical protein